MTRPRPEADELARRLERRGATAIVAPAIELAPVRSAALTRALRELAEGAFSWVTLTSPRTVDVLAEHLTPRQLRANVAAVGEGTAEAFRRWSGREADLVPKA
ncbi:MAG: uroporphyrinogen-III synthase, partial [Actinomycetota bacterium]